MDLKAASDEELVLAFQRKDLQALEEFFERHQRIALAVAYRVLKNGKLRKRSSRRLFWRSGVRQTPTGLKKGRPAPGFLAL